MPKNYEPYNMTANKNGSDGDCNFDVDVNPGENVVFENHTHTPGNSEGDAYFVIEDDPGQQSTTINVSGNWSNTGVDETEVKAKVKDKNGTVKGSKSVAYQL